jgi:hypothetical protein
MLGFFSKETFCRPNRLWDENMKNLAAKYHLEVKNITLTFSQVISFLDPISTVLPKPFLYAKLYLASLLSVASIVRERLCLSRKSRPLRAQLFVHRRVKFATNHKNI